MLRHANTATAATTTTAPATATHLCLLRDSRKPIGWAAITEGWLDIDIKTPPPRAAAPPGTSSPTATARLQRVHADHSALQVVAVRTHVVQRRRVSVDEQRVGL